MLLIDAVANYGMQPEADKSSPAEQDDRRGVTFSPEFIELHERNRINRMIFEMLYPVTHKLTPSEEADRHAIMMDFY